MTLLSLQQYLPFTVLKPTKEYNTCRILYVATVLTVYGIETVHLGKYYSLYLVATVLTVYGIETFSVARDIRCQFCCNSTYRLRY